MATVPDVPAGAAPADVVPAGVASAGARSSAGGARSGDAGAALRLLKPEVLARLGSLELVARTVVDGVLTGLHRSPHFGHSQEFAEYRAYGEGDDLRFVDWNVYARTGRAYVKRFHGDTSMQLNLLVDASASMGFGSPVSKLDVARWLGASLAWLARRQRDALSVAVFDERLREFQPPSTRPDALPRALGLLHRSAPGAGTDLAGALEGLRATVVRRGLVALVSDLYADPDEVLAGLQPFAHAGHDIAVFRVLDPAEIEPELPRTAALRSLEDGRDTVVDPAFLAAGYRERFAAHAAALEEACRRAGAALVEVRTDRPLDAAVHAWLRLRERGGR